MTRELPNVPSAVTSPQPITAADWNDFAYSVAFHTHPPAAFLLQTVGQAISTATATKVAYDSAVRDSDAGHDPTANSSRYTVQIPGLYQVMAVGYVPGTAAAGSERYLAITVNGTAVWSMEISNTAFWGCTGMDIPLNTGDYVETQIWQDSGATDYTKTATNHYDCMMLLVWVGK